MANGGVISAGSAPQTKQAPTVTQTNFAGSGIAPVGNAAAPKAGKGAPTALAQGKSPSRYSRNIAARDLPPALMVKLAGRDSELNSPEPDIDAGAPSGDSVSVVGYKSGDKSAPPIVWDETYEYNSKDSNLADFAKKAKWLGILKAAQLGKPDMDDATAMYAHYWDNNGEPVEFDYEEAYREDEGVKKSVDDEIRNTQRGVEEMIQQGQTEFSFTSTEARGNSEYPTTENWQKAIGGYQQWSSGDVVVDGDTVTMTVTVHAVDRYDFNPGQHDIASGAPDDDNGRFTEIGWAKPFDSSGEITRTVSWKIGDPDSLTISDEGSPEENRGGEDR